MADYQTNGDTTRDGSGRTERVIEHSKALREEAQALAGELRQAATDIQGKLDLQGRMERNPYATLAVAAGVGYVLGGGLLTPFTGRVLRWGVKLMLLPMLKNELAAFGEAAASGAFSSQD